MKHRIDQLVAAVAARTELGAEHLANRFIRASREVLDLHKPMAWYLECSCPGKWDDDTGEHFYVGDESFLTCERERADDRCLECTPENCDDDMVMSVQYPCDTVKRVVTAVIGSDLETATQLLTKHSDLLKTLAILDPAADDGRWCRCAMCGVRYSFDGGKHHCEPDPNRIGMEGVPYL